MTLGRRLRVLRVGAGLRQVELAARSGVGQSTITRIERDLHMPHRSTLKALAAALDVELAVLRAPEEATP